MTLKSDYKYKYQKVSMVDYLSKYFTQRHWMHNFILVYLLTYLTWFKILIAKGEVDEWL